MLRKAGIALAGALVLLILAAAGYSAAMSGSFYTPASFHAFTAYQPLAGPVLVVGGTQGTGLEIIRELAARGQPVVAAVRATSSTAALDELGVPKIVLDAMQRDQVFAAIESGRYSALISTLGTAGRDLPEKRSFLESIVEGQAKMDPARRPDHVGNRNLMDAAKAAGIRRFVFVTVIGTGTSAGAVPALGKRMLEDIIQLKDQAEQHLQASGLNYTIIRPGGLGLRSLAPTGTARLTEDARSFSYIGRTDLARLAVAALGDPATGGKVYTAWDPARRNVWDLLVD